MSQRLTAEEKRRQKQQATIGLASNILGISAGTAALAASARNKAFKNPNNANNAGPVTSRMLTKIKMSPKNKKRLILAGAGGAVGLQAANLGGDLVTNRVLAREVKKNDMTMISKAEGAVSRNGYGVNLEKAEKAKKKSRPFQRDGQMGGALPLGAGVGIGAMGVMQRRGSKKAVAEAFQHRRDALDYTLASNKGVKSTNVATEKTRNANSKKIAEQKMLAQNSRMHASESMAQAKLLHNSGKKNMKIGAGLAAVGASGLAYDHARGKKNVNKAYRRFDPEADRQRRMGQAQGVSLATGILAGAGAKKHFTTELKHKGKDVLGIAAKPGQGRRGVALAGLSAIATAGGLASYKRSLSVRNQPWT